MIAMAIIIAMNLNSNSYDMLSWLAVVARCRGSPSPPVLLRTALLKRAFADLGCIWWGGKYHPTESQQ